MNESAVYEIRLKDSFSSPLKSLESKMNGFEGKVGGLKSSFSGLGETITGAFAGGLVVGGIAALVSGLKEIVTGSIEVTREFTNMKEAIEFASGSQAATNIKFLDDTINELGLDITSTYKGFKTFEGALMGTSLEGEKGREIFTAVSKAATVMKLSADSTEGAFLALGQMISKGTVSAEELRGQLGERLPGAFQIAARAMGVTTSKLGDMMKKGEVVAEDFLPKFAKELERTFSPGVLKAQNSFNANMNRFSNFILRGKLAIGNGLLPVLNELVSVIPRLDFSGITDTFKDMFAPLKEIANMFSEIFGSVGLNIGVFDVFQALIKSLALTFRAATTGLMIFYTGYKIILQAVKDSYLIWQGLGDIISGVFTLDQTKIYGGINKIKVGFSDMAENAKNSAVDFVKGQADAYKKIFTTWGTGGEDKKAGAGGLGSGAMGGLSSKSAMGAKSEGSGVEKISAGTRNVVININKLVENVNISKTLDKMGNSEMVEAIKRTLLTATNDVNIMAGS